jgi:steroid 5-alpha reductase family enzyme
MKEFYIGLGIIFILLVIKGVITVREKTKEKRELKRKYQETLKDFKDIK